jgi:GABA(A) receptor-associated protein
MNKSVFKKLKQSKLSMSQMLDNARLNIGENLNDLRNSINEKIIEKSNLNSSFKKKHSFQERLNESYRIREKYPDRYPIICERGRGADVPTIDRKKYLVPNDISIANFMYIIRKRIKLPPEKSIYLFFGDTQLLPTNTLISMAYENHHDKDGFLYITYNGESTFG